MRKSVKRMQVKELNTMANQPRSNYEEVKILFEPKPLTNVDLKFFTETRVVYIVVQLRITPYF